jgi:hypothetical protein
MIYGCTQMLMSINLEILLHLTKGDIPLQCHLDPNFKENMSLLKRAGG